ncbi:MAG: uridine kinase [Pyrinomonadaceae bacterium]
MIIGLCGGTGSGKTTMARRIVDLIGADFVNLIEQDSYYKDLSHISLSERQKVNYDHPDSLDFEELTEDLMRLRGGESVKMPVYDFASHTRNGDHITLEPRPVTIVEGILIFTVPELRELMDLKVFLDTSSDTRLLRRIRRDLEERGRSLEQTLHQYESTIRPMHHIFVEPCKECADIVIPESGETGLLEKMLASLVVSEIQKSPTTL